MKSPRPKYHPGEMARRLYDWVVHWAQTRHALSALFGISFVESSFFPIPPDVLLIAIGVGQPKRAMKAAAVCLVGSILGGLLGYAIGYGLWQALDEIFFTYIPGFSPELFEKVKTLYHNNAFLAIFTAGFTPIPYKVFTIAAGVAEIQLGEFLFASILSRGLRFFLVAGALRLFGPTFKQILEKYFDLVTIAFTILLVGGFLLLKVIFH